MPALAAHLVGQALEARRQRGPVALGCDKGGDERAHGLAGPGHHIVERLGQATSQPDFVAGPPELGRQRTRGPGRHRRHRQRHREPGADRQHEKVDDLGEVGGEVDQPAALGSAGLHGGKRPPDQGGGGNGEGEHGYDGQARQHRPAEAAGG